MHRPLVLGLAAAVATACGTVDLGPQPADLSPCRPSPAFFYQRVWPEFLAKDYGGKRCADSDCHDATSGRQPLLQPPTSMGMLPLPPDWDAVYTATIRQVRCTDVSASPLLAFPDGRRVHGGQKLIERDGPEETLVSMWVTAP